MGKFVVNATSLRALERSLLGLAVELDDGGVVSEKYGIQNGTGSDGSTITNWGHLNSADEALYDYFTAWQNALAIIGTNIKVLSEQLGEGAKEYEQTEQALDQLFASILNPPKTPVNPPNGLPVIPGVTVPGLIGADPPPPSK